MRKSRKIPLPVKPTFAILVDGECEAWYFQMLLRNEKGLGVHLKPEIPQNKTLKEQYERAVELSRHYDKVFWIVDYDVIIKQTKQAGKGKHTAQNEFRAYLNEIQNKYKNVQVLINNPCLEFWLLLHFEATGKFYTDCESATRRLKKYLPGYCKKRKYFTKEGNDIYLKLKPHLKKAIANAKKLPDFSLDNPHSAITQMHLFFETKPIKSITEGLK